MQNKKIIIIGAGIGGMSAGCYGQMNGYDTEIYEMHDKHGGLCTAWKRKEYIIDGCYEWMIGINPDSIFNKLWMEVGALQNKEIMVHQEFCRCEFGSDKTVIFYSDADKLKSHLLEVAPEDARAIDDITAAIKKFAGFFRYAMSKTAPKGLAGRINIGFKSLPLRKYFKKFGKVSIKEYAQKNIKNTYLKEALLEIFLTDYTMAIFLFNMAYYCNKDAGLPVGGSLGVVNSIAERYISLGGRINYKSKVKNIIVKDNKAEGIELEDGIKAYGDLIISAADGHHTLFNLLNGQYLTETLKRCYSGVYPTFTSHNYTPFEYWEKFDRHSPEYREEKRKIAEEVIKTAEKRFPSIRGNIEVIDTATPLTYSRYTNVWRGAYMTWITTPGSDELTKISDKLPGLDNFYMAGQWVSSPGTPGALRTGRKVIQDICKKDGKIFQTSGSL